MSKSSTISKYGMIKALHKVYLSELLVLPFENGKSYLSGYLVFVSTNIICILFKKTSSSVLSGGGIWNRRGCSSEILNLTSKGDHLGVAQAFCDP